MPELTLTAWLGGDTSSAGRDGPSCEVLIGASFLRFFVLTLVSKEKAQKDIWILYQSKLQQNTSVAAENCRHTCTELVFEHCSLISFLNGAWVSSALVHMELQQTLVVLNDRKPSVSSSLCPQKPSSESVPVFGWLWGGKTLGREGSFQPVRGYKCVALNVWKYRVGWIWIPCKFVQDGAINTADPCEQSFPSVGDAHRATFWARTCCPLPLPLFSGFWGRRGDWPGRGKKLGNEMRHEGCTRVFYQVHLRFSSAYHITQTALEEPSIYPLP